MIASGLSSVSRTIRVLTNRLMASSFLPFRPVFGAGPEGTGGSMGAPGRGRAGSSGGMDSPGGPEVDPELPCKRPVACVADIQMLPLCGCHNIGPDQDRHLPPS